MVHTRVGYAGGKIANPSYYNLGGHSETIQVDYDPEIIIYAELLKIFWESHAPQYPSYSQQYASIIFYHDETQKELALESIAVEESHIGRKIYTQVKPFESFTLAEDYHQKYYLRSSPVLFQELSDIYPGANDLINSTAAARINGYLGGNGSIERLQQQIHKLGLTADAEKELLKLGNQILQTASGDYCPVIE